MEGGRGKQSSSLTIRGKQKETFFLENGSMLLEKMLSFCNEKCTPLRNFSSKEILLATNNFDTHVIKDEGHYTLYKGSFGSHLVSIKKYGGHGWTLATLKSLAICDIVMTSQMSKHKNVLKLIGYCLEFEIPVAVYEYAGSVRLSKFLDSRVVTNEVKLVLFWKSRLRIANQIANAIVYLHTALPKPVIHRDLKPAGVIIDQLGVAKLFDLSLSISIPDGETQVEDLVTGTFGFVDPEYFMSSFVSGKSDVYSFGVMLLILLTGQMVFDMGRGEDVAHLVTYVKKYFDEDCFKEIVDPIILGEGAGSEKDQQLQAFLALALRCTQEQGENRPDMIDVARELRKIERSNHVG